MSSSQPPGRSRTCDTCSRMNIESLGSPDGFSHVSKKLASCYLCSEIFTFVGEEMENTPIQIKLSPGVSSMNMGAAICSLRIELGTQSSKSYVSTPVHVITEEGDPAAVEYDVPAFRSVTSSGSQESLSIAKAWLEHCVENHDCHESLFVPQSDAVEERSTIYPTRLLDLQAFNGDCSDIRLIEKPASGSTYSTLSHCWGINPDTRWQATTSTLQELREKIRYADLPKTYRDAISVCRSLMIRYLWIDSLCIIQDSKEDWVHEAATMAYVYSNSHLTISADWSMNAQGGCYKVHDAPRGIDENTTRNANVLSNGERSCLYFPKWYMPSHQLLDFTHLAGRAWAYQERLLSRRNLHFTGDQLFWECKGGFAGEDMMPRSPGSLKPASLLQIRVWDDIERRLHVWCYWIIKQYSFAKITFPTDRLRLYQPWQKFLQTPCALRI